MNKVSVKNTENYKWGNDCDGWHLVKTKNLSVIQESVPTGCSEVAHYHEKAEQFFYVLSGVATLVIDSEIVTLNTNEGLHVPANVKHQLKNDSSETLNFIVVSTPPSHGDRVLV